MTTPQPRPGPAPLVNRRAREADGVAEARRRHPEVAARAAARDEELNTINSYRLGNPTARKATGPVTLADIKRRERLIFERNQRR